MGKIILSVRTKWINACDSGICIFNEHGEVTSIICQVENIIYCYRTGGFQNEMRVETLHENVEGNIISSISIFF